MKFDMNRAWEEGVRLLRTNRELVLVLAGLFLFLPPFALGIFSPETLSAPAIENTETAQAEMMAFVSRNGVGLLFVQILQALGFLSLLALFARRRPTVGQAIKTGAIELLPLIAAQVFVTITLVALGGMAVAAVAAAAGQGAAFIVVLIVLAIALIVLARLVALAPLLVFEQRLNPFAAMVDSWRLTKGHGRRIFIFLLLVGIALTIVSLLVGGLIALLTALIGNAEVANLLSSALSALFGAVWLSLIVALLAAIFSQLTSGRSDVSPLGNRKDASG